MNDERARGFPAFGPSRARGRRGGSWWGNAWVAAVEDTALDAEQLRKGRRYASSGVVGSITVSPGRIAAPVHDAEVYRTEVRMEPLGDGEWERFLDRVAARVGHIAALLERDMPRELIETAEDAGVTLLPGIGDLDPECTCDGWELPCRHAAALCYQVAWLLDADPFVLLLLRGRSEREVLAELQQRNAALSTSSTTESALRAGNSSTMDGVPASAAYAAVPAALPEPPELPSPRAFSLALPQVPDVDTEALEFLAADAAARARAILAGEPLPVLDVWQDAVRLAADADTWIAARLRHAAEQAAGSDGPEFDRAVQAWRRGGAAGLAVLREPWSPPIADLSRARAAFADVADGEPTVSRNRCELGEDQLRFGRDGRWYPYRHRDGAWWPAGPPHRAADAALAELAELAD